MQLPVFENAYLLQSVGWAVANSFWQVGLLWLLYCVITASDKKLSPILKHNLSVALMGAAFIWFLLTIAENFRILSGNSYSSETETLKNWLSNFTYINGMLPYLSCLYLLILCLYVIRFVQRLIANIILQRNGLTKAPIDFRLFATHTAGHIGIKKKIQVWISANIDVPCVTGFIKPIILIPPAILNHLSTSQVEAILVHELAHIKRYDHLVNLVQSIIEVVLFFNPFIFLLSKFARLERENCCDDWVINYRFNHFTYAEALLVLEEQRQLRPALVLASTNNKKYLLSRIKRLFHTAPQINVSRSEQLKFLFISLSLGFILFAALPDMPERQVKITDFQNTTKLSQPEKMINSYKEQVEKEVVSEVLTPQTAFKKGNIKKSRYDKEAKTVEKNYINAFVNEELLADHTPELAVPVLAARKDMPDEMRYIVEIEEQESGKKQTNTYVFELKNQNGKTSVKPLIILNKLKVTIKPGNVSPIDSLVKAPKKRVTS
jgi:beta-lactamase regulating signal transducer with metallopeptidase domain